MRTSGSPVHVLVVGRSRTDRVRAARAQQASDGLPPAAIVSLDAATLPFVRPEQAGLPAGHPRLFRLADIERAFPDTQQSGTRLVLTQSTYTLQKWFDLLRDGDRVVATADRAALQRAAPEAFAKRGPWRHFDIVDLDSESPGEQPRSGPAARVSAPLPLKNLSFAPTNIERLLARAFAFTSAVQRARVCRQAVAAAPESAVAALALASACRERQRLAAARAALESAIHLAPDWEAAHYEDGKFWLACEDLGRARAAFARAASLMPNFSAAFSNLGATLGELNEPDAALAAFTQALAGDPDNPTILNNLGVVNREIGRLGDSEAACRRVVAVAPEFVFGHYNLGHTLFLAGRFVEALAAYEEGQRRDPEQNRRQGCRLAVVRFATGDLAGAERDLSRFAGLAPPDEREDLLLEAYEIVQELVQAAPVPSGHQAFLDRIAAQIQRE